jgi:hypothetical protein
VFAYDAFRLAWLPDGHIHMAAADLDRRRAGHVGRIEMVEVPPSKVESGVFEQCCGKPLVERLVLNIFDQTHNFASPSVTSVSTVAVCRQKRGSRPRSRNLVVPGIPTIHSWSSKTLGSIGLILGKPSERSVASRHRLPVAAWRRVKMAAIRGAPSVNSFQVVMDVTLRHAALPTVGRWDVRNWP